MTIDFNAPFDDINLDAEKSEFLENLQANILKGHGRDHVALLFLQIKDTEAARRFFHSYKVTDALTQYLDTKAFKETGVPGGVVQLAFLSKAGLRSFGLGSDFDKEQLFSNGMQNDELVLDNRDTSSWEIEFTRIIDVLLLLAHDDEVELAAKLGDLVEDFGLEFSPFNVIQVQSGRSYRNGDGEGVEHFGYVDGRSQPLLLQSQINAERENRRGGIEKYNPSAPLKQVLVSDPLSLSGFGSYFVFRKLEQNVAGFLGAEDDLGEEALQLQGADRERAGAMVVGRFEDGTPLVLDSESIGTPVINNFNYDDDLDGSKCPFHAHIRKSNPRGSSPGGLDFDKSVQMARRGITYGTRIQHPDTKEFIDKPAGGVGLLFMAYQASIEDQFHFMQTRWINDSDFPFANVGIDPIIGQGHSSDQRWLPNYGETSSPTELLFRGFVSLKGGEYFYAPSIAGLKAL